MELATRKDVEDVERRLRGRITELERVIQGLKVQLENATTKDWRRTVGMFTGDETMKQIDEAGRKIREADREKARKAAQRADRRNTQRAAIRAKK